MLAQMGSEPLHKIQQARERMAETHWYGGLSDESKARLRGLGGAVYGLAALTKTLVGFFLGTLYFDAIARQSMVRRVLSSLRMSATSHAASGENTRRGAGDGASSNNRRGIQVPPRARQA